MDRWGQLLSGQRAFYGLAQDAPNAAGFFVHNLVTFILERVLRSIQVRFKQRRSSNLIGIGDIAGVQGGTGAGLEEDRQVRAPTL